MNNKNWIKSAAMILVCLFVVNTVCFADMDTLATLAGNPDIYAEMKEDMNERLSDHQRYIDESIKEYAEGHADSVVSVTDLSGINDVFRESVRLSKGEDAVKQMEEVLVSSGGRIQVMFIENENKLSVFEGKIVWGHAGTYVTVFALKSEKNTENGIRKIVGRIFHEIWARSTRAKDLYEEEIRKAQPKTPEEVKYAAMASREKYEKEVELVVAEMEEFGFIHSPRLQEIFGNLLFENKIDFINRDFTYPGEEANAFLEPVFVVGLSPKDFDTRRREYYYYAHSSFISRYGEYFVLGDRCWSAVSGKALALPFKGEIFAPDFSPTDPYLAVSYRGDFNSGEIFNVKTREKISITGLSGHVKMFGSFSHSGKFIVAYLNDGTAQIIDMDRRIVVKTFFYKDINHIHFSYHDKYAVVGLGETYQYESILFDLKENKEIVLSSEQGAGKIKYIAISPNEKYASFTYGNNLKMIHNLKTGKQSVMPQDIKSMNFLSTSGTLFILRKNGDAGIWNIKTKKFQLIVSNVVEFQVKGDYKNVFIRYDVTKMDNNMPSSALYSVLNRNLVPLDTKGALLNENFSNNGKHLVVYNSFRGVENLVYDTISAKVLPIKLEYKDKPFFSKDGNTLVVFSPTAVKLYDLAKSEYIKDEGKWDPAGDLKKMYGLEVSRTIKDIEAICERHYTTIEVELRVLRELGLLVRNGDGRKNNTYLYSLNPILEKAIDKGNLNIHVKKAIAGAILKKYDLYFPRTIKELVKICRKDITTVRMEIEILSKLKLISKGASEDKFRPLQYRLHPELEMYKNELIGSNMLLKIVEIDKKKTKGKVAEVLKSLHEQNSVQTIASLMNNLGRSEAFVREAIKLLRTLNLIKGVNTKRQNGAFSYELEPILKGFTKSQMQVICEMEDINKKINSGDLSDIHTNIIKKIQAIVNDENVRLAPPVPDTKVLWHVFANGLISFQEQTSGLGTQINRMSDNKNGTERIKILNEKENLNEVLENLAKDPSNIVHVMVNGDASLENIPEKIKIAIFNGEIGDYSQVIGIMAVSRALAIEDIAERNKALCRLYKLLTGEEFKGTLPETRDPKELARAIVFNLPEIMVLNYDELIELNEMKIFYLKNA